MLHHMGGTTCTAGTIREKYSTPREGILQIESTTIVGDRSETCIQVSTVVGCASVCPSWLLLFRIISSTER